MRFLRCCVLKSGKSLIGCLPLRGCWQRDNFSSPCFVFHGQPESFLHYNRTVSRRAANSIEFYSSSTYVTKQRWAFIAIIYRRYFFTVYRYRSKKFGFIDYRYRFCNIFRYRDKRFFVHTAFKVRELALWQNSRR